jgi:pimeloyl-ACP methyl ester carboxylesterase
MFFKEKGSMSPERFNQLINPLGYKSQLYQTKTEDGYLLQIFRVSNRTGTFNDNRPVVMIQHGLQDSADSWVVNDEHRCLPFHLLKNNFDVWLTNSRGNKYSKEHLTLKNSNKQFWDFSYMEMGRYDVPANVKLILAITNQEKLFYIGHS